MASRGWEHVTLADLRQRKIGVQPKPSKYRNVKVTIDGEQFDSKREAAYWQGLKAREAAREIHSLARQVPFALCCPDRTSIEDQQVRSALVVAQYFADFSYYDRDGTRHVVDAKGHRTQEYRLKKKWVELQDGVLIEEV
jgi:hypothetical protein